MGGRLGGGGGCRRRGLGGVAGARARILGGFGEVGVALAAELSAELLSVQAGEH
jgi:hypothetical protein